MSRTPSPYLYLQPPLKKVPVACVNCGALWSLSKHHRHRQHVRRCYACALICLPGYDGQLRMFSEEALLAGAAAHAVMDQLEIRGSIKRGDLIQRLAQHLKIHTQQVHVSHMTTLGRLEVARWCAVELDAMVRQQAREFEQQRERVLRTAEGVRP